MITRKCPNHEARPSRGTKRKDEDQMMTKQTPYVTTDAQTEKNCKRESAMERSVGKLLKIKTSFTRAKPQP